MSTAVASAAGLWSTVIAVLLPAVSAYSVNHHEPVLCEDMRLKCAYGAGCSLALHNYFSKCEPVLVENSTTCPEQCLHALVTLTSTDDGKQMMNCTCRDRFCEETKARVEVCRALVIETSKDETVVPCDLAWWICSVDRACATALGYYNTYCRRMLEGVTCSERCLNSVEILRRQEKAAKLNRCRCAGPSAFECLMNKQSTVRLCYNGGHGHGHGKGGGGGGGGRKSARKHRPRMFDQDPDRAEVEMMLANPNYRPDERFIDGYQPAVPGGASPARGRSPPAGVLCAVAAALILVTAALRDAPQ